VTADEAETWLDQLEAGMTGNCLNVTFDLVATRIA